MPARVERIKITTHADMWATGVLWLPGAGLLAAAPAAVTRLIDFIGDGRIRQISDAWQDARLRPASPNKIG